MAAHRKERRNKGGGVTRVASIPRGKKNTKGVAVGGPGDTHGSARDTKVPKRKKKVRQRRQNSEEDGAGTEEAQAKRRGRERAVEQERKKGNSGAASWRVFCGRRREMVQTPERGTEKRRKRGKSGRIEGEEEEERRSEERKNRREDGSGRRKTRPG